MVQSELARWLCTALFAGIGGVCALRLVTSARSAGPRCADRADAAGRPPAPHEDVAQVVMGLGMIAMVLSWVRLLPDPVWLAVFGVQAAAFATLLLRTPPAPDRDSWQCVHHLVASVAMGYMVVGMTHRAAGGQPHAMAPLAGSFGMYFLGYAAWSAARAVRAAARGGAARSRPVLLRPRLVEGGRALMGGGMAYVLLAG